MPRSEYNTDNTDNTLDGDVFIEITASQRDLAECSLFEDRRLFPANTEAETEDDSYTLNCTGTLTLEDGRVFSSIIIYVTLPAIVVSSFSGVRVDFWFLAAFGLRFAANAVMLGCP